MIENQNISNDITVEEKVDDSGEDVILAEEENATSIYNLSEEDLVAKTANAVELTLNDNARVGVSGSFSCTETTECWYKFIVPETAIYEIYTSHGIPTIVLLYDSSGDCITQCKSEGERTDTFISQELQMNQVCYICVLPCNSITGSFYLTLSQVVHAKSISITPKRLHLQPNVAGTNSLYYTSGLHVKFDPVYTTNKKVHWTSSNPSIVESGGFDGYIRAQPNKTGRVYITATAEDGNHQAVAEISVGDLNGEFHIINERSNKFLSAKGKYVTELSDSHELICADEDGSEAQIWKFTPLSNPNTFRVESQIDPSFAMNANVGDTQCNATLSKGDANDSIVYFEPHGGGYYKIKTNSGMCLTANPRTGGAGVIWSAENTGESQYWYLSAVDMVRREAEKVEYHLLCNNDLTKALRVGRKNVFTIDEPLFVRGERRSYWNRQKWTLKGVGDKKKLYTQLNQSYCLCNNVQDGINEVYVSNSATDENSYLTIISYGNEGLFEIKLTNSDLYLTLVECERHGSLAYWGEWKAYDTVNHHLQLWKFVEQPASHCHGVDTDHQIDDTTAHVLKLNNKGFVARYYANKENISSNYHYKILTATEVTAIHNQGLKIVSIYEDGGKSFSTIRGTSDATEALRLATMLEQPSGSAIYFAVEPDYSNQTTLIQDYFKAVYETFKNDGRYKVGVYGLAKVCKAIKDDLGYADFSWLGQSNYASNSSIEGDADYIFYDSEEKYDIKQSEPVSYNGIDFDSDTSIRSNYGQW